MLGFLRWLLQETSGQDLAEYALLLTLIVLVVVAALPAFASALTDAYGNMAQVFAAKKTCCD